MQKSIYQDSGGVKDIVGVEIIESTTSAISMDAGRRQRTSQITTLFDGKTLNADEPDLWHGAGTPGAAVFSVNKMNLSVTAGQWYVREQNWFSPYFSGKSQLVEFTFENFHTQSNITKRIGYFSSSSVSPYITSLDGFFLENDGTTLALKVYNDGTLTASIDWTDWDSYSQLSTYDWSKFTVGFFDFLWLGGTELRLFIQMPTGGFLLAHTYHHAGNKSGTFISSPNHPLRYEIRSTTGTGNFSFVCGQISSEGSNNESGRSHSIYNPTAITCNTVGTIYALIGIKKQIAFRTNVSKLVGMGCVDSATNDSGILMLIKNPTLSASLTYANKDRVQVAIATNQTVTANTGTIIAAIPVGTNGNNEIADNNFMLFLQNYIDDTLAEYVLAYMPITLNQTISGVLSYKIY